MKKRLLRLVKLMLNGETLFAPRMTLKDAYALTKIGFHVQSTQTRSEARSFQLVTTYKKLLNTHELDKEINDYWTAHNKAIYKNLTNLEQP